VRSSSRRWGVSLATVGSLLVLATPARAEVVWRGGFEPGDLSEWNEFTGPIDERVTIVDDPVRDGLLAARVEIRPGDLGNGGLNRVEIGYHPPGGWTEGTERYYAWSLMMPAEVELGDAWHLLTYFEAEVLYTNSMSFRLYGDGTLSFCTFVGGEVVHWSTPFVQGEWHDFVLHVVWSPEADAGVVELWYDDELVLPATNVATMHTDDGGTAHSTFLHQGVLRYEGITTTEVLFVDGTMEATELADVMPEPGATSTGGDETTTTSDDGTSDAGSGSGIDGTESVDDASATAADDDGDDEAVASDGAASTGEATTGAPATGDGGDGCGCDASLPTRWPGLLLVWLLARARRRRSGG
jgi:hypothetical protein